MLSRLCLVAEAQNVFTFAVPDDDVDNVDGDDVDVDNDYEHDGGGLWLVRLPPNKCTFGHRLQEEEPLANACLSHLISHLKAG